jgi:homoserine O-acetyltransferase
MGGARALEWIIGYPDRVRSALLLAVGARATTDQIGTQATQIAAITADPNWQSGDYHDTGRTPDAGLTIARRFAHLTYRGEVELNTRFANDSQGDEDLATGGTTRCRATWSTRATNCWPALTPAPMWS